MNLNYSFFLSACVCVCAVHIVDSVWSWVSLNRHRLNFLINNDICVDLCTVIDLMGITVRWMPFFARSTCHHHHHITTFQSVFLFTLASLGNSKLLTLLQTNSWNAARLFKKIVSKQHLAWNSVQFKHSWHWWWSQFY